MEMGQISHALKPNAHAGNWNKYLAFGGGRGMKAGGNGGVGRGQYSILNKQETEPYEIANI